MMIGGTDRQGKNRGLQMTLDQCALKTYRTDQTSKQLNGYCWPNQSVLLVVVTEILVGCIISVGNNTGESNNILRTVEGFTESNDVTSMDTGAPILAPPSDLFKKE